MTAVWVVTAALVAGVVVPFGWPRAPLRRLMSAPRVSCPGWLLPKADALPVRVRGMASAGAMVAVILLLSGPLPVSLAVGCALGTVVFWGLGRLESGGAAAARAELVAELPSALDVLAACVAAGMPLRRATQAVAAAVGGELGERLASVGARTAAGFSDGDAWAAVRDDEVLGSLARDLARAADAGTAIGALVARHADAARAAAHAAALARARAVGVRTVIPVSVCYLPAFFLLGVVPVIAGVVASLLG